MACLITANTAPSMILPGRPMGAGLPTASPPATSSALSSSAAWIAGKRISPRNPCWKMSRPLSIQMASISISWDTAPSVLYAICSNSSGAFPVAYCPTRSRCAATCTRPFTANQNCCQAKLNGAKKSEAASEKNGSDKNGETAPEDERAEEEETARSEPSFAIDLEGITERVIPFPVGEARYAAVRAIRGKALFLIFPIPPVSSDDYPLRGWIESYDLENQKNERLIENVNDFTLSRDYKWLLYRSRQRLRVLKAGEKPPREGNDHPGRESGWLDLSRVKVSVQPEAEWKQMFAEAWRLQREHFWDEDMSGIDWD